MFTTKINDTIYYVTEDKVINKQYAKANVLAIITKCEDDYRLKFNTPYYYEMETVNPNMHNKYLGVTKTLRNAKEIIYKTLEHKI